MLIALAHEAAAESRSAINPTVCSMWRNFCDRPAAEVPHTEPAATPFNSRPWVLSVALRLQSEVLGVATLHAGRTDWIADLSNRAFDPAGGFWLRPALMN